LYQEPENYNEVQANRFYNKYLNSLEKAASQVLDESGYKLKAFDSIKLDYGWD